MEPLTALQAIETQPKSASRLARLLHRKIPSIQVIRLACHDRRLVIELSSPSYYRLQQLVSALQAVGVRLVEPRIVEIEIIARIDAQQGSLQLLVATSK